MKKLLLSILYVFIFAYPAFTQSDTLPNNQHFSIKDYKSDTEIYTKSIDFQNGNNLYKDTLRYDRKYKYVLKNVNRFIYKEASAEQKGENLNMEVPEIFKTLTLPSFINTTRKALPDSIITSTESAAVQAFRSDKAKPPCSCIKAKDILDSADLARLQQNIKSLSDTIKMFSTFSTLDNEMEKLKRNSNLSGPSIISEKIKLVRDSLRLSSMPEKDVQKLITSRYKTLRQNADSIHKNDISKIAKKITDTLQIVIKGLKKCFYCADTCKVKITQPTLTANPFYELRDCIEELQGYNDEVKESLLAINKLRVGISTAFSEGKIDDLQKNYNLLVHENFELELEPFIADKDIHEITFTTGAEGPLEFGLPAKRTIKIKAVTTGGWKVDYSTGAFFNIGSNKFLGPEYYFEERARDTTKAVIEAQRTKKAMLSIGALMHIYPRVNSFFRPGFAFGVSTTLGFDVLNFHGGVSIMLGKPGKVNRVIISGGLTLREVSLLDSRFALNQFRKDYGDSVPTSKNFPVAGGFFSLTYNLSNINK